MKHDGKEKKERPPEYQLLITPHINESDNSRRTLFCLETTRDFASFRYELSVKEDIEDHTIRYTVLGLKPPRLSLPAAGHARFSREYDNLRGTYRIEIVGLDGSVDVFSIRISEKKVQLLQAPADRFVNLVVDRTSAN